tara:strand:+ start:316 stop:942 length:627 start_codon:yes stop_codon:yes gene_type:complete
MSFCSYEEAWGSPYDADNTQNKNYDHVKKEHSQNDYEDFSNNNDGMITTPPLKGSLLGGAIPDEQWNTNTPTICEKPDLLALESKFDQKIDKLISSIDKYTTNIRNEFCDKSDTTWTDLLLFIAIGIFFIVLLDLFFKFGKMIVESNYKKFNSMQQTPIYSNANIGQNMMQNMRMPQMQTPQMQAPSQIPQMTNPNQSMFYDNLPRST